MQNATPADSAPLASGLYGDISYYGFNSPFGNGYNGCNNSDPIDEIVCRKNFVLIVSSGADLTGTVFTTNPDLSTFSTDSCTVTAGREANRSKPLVKNACYGFMNDLRSDKLAKQQVTTFTINTMGTAANGQILQDAALAGGGKYYDASIATNLEAQLKLAFQDMLARAAAGTAASVLASGEGSGANLVQAVFYPRRKFGDKEISWIGRLSNLWYYVDPRFSTSSIREDAADVDDVAKVLDLKTAPSGTHQDYITSLRFNGEATVARRWTDTNGDGVVDGLLDPVNPDIQFEYLKTLWEAGKLLWDRTPDSRTLYTALTGSNRIDFSTANRTALRPYLQASSDSEAEAIIRWVRGEDMPSYRPRSVQIATCSNNTNHICSVDADCGIGHTCVLTGPNTWKLGDVLNSTPKISTWQALNGYHTVMNDSTYGEPGKDPYYGDPADSTHYITSSGYKNRGMIFAGANDGMLHAFKLGTLELKWAGQTATEKAKLSGTNLGQEVWAYIPKNALPYLTYDTDPGYCHVYTVDLTPHIFDASIGRPADCSETDTADCIKSPTTWRTIVIGGMRYGGACRKKGDACNSGSDCVNTPIVDPADAAKGLGYSSYFALDVTDQNNPQVLWEFSHPELGFSTSGPTVVRINAKNPDGTSDRNKNGHWFVVFGSGPTGPIDTSNQQFLGRSDQPLKIFVLPLAGDGSLAAPPIDTGIPMAFAGSVYNATFDADLNYEDDVMFVPYVKKCTSSSGICTVDTWTDGGVGRITTKEDKNPANWVWSKVVDRTGPLTSAVVKLRNIGTNTLWLFFGAGRYFYELTGGDADDGSGQRSIYGLKDPCLTPAGYVQTCTTSVDRATLTNVTNVLDVVINPAAGWFINLDPDPSPASDFRAEREITDPLAASTGVVFFTTYKPYTNQCRLGGNSFIWAVKYDTGGSAETLLKGKALIQVSTGSIEQMDLSSAFTDAGGRKTGGMEGVPPTSQGLSIMTTPPAVKRVLHKRER
jgi:type IV pilus assembly protein PilY1